MKKFVIHPFGFLISIATAGIFGFVVCKITLPCKNQDVVQHIQGFYDAQKGDVITTAADQKIGDEVNGYIHQLDSKLLTNEEVFIPKDKLAELLVSEKDYCGLFIRRGLQSVGGISQLVDIVWVGTNVQNNQKCENPTYSTFPPKPAIPPEAIPNAYLIIGGGRHCSCLPCCGI